jgi:predicted dehydrogenase
MPMPVRVGVIGCGSIATAVHLRVLRHLSGVRVMAVADPLEDARRRALQIVPDAVALASADELLAVNDLDAVVVTASTMTHAPLALSVLRSGRHLFLEKPLGISVAEGHLVIEAGRASDRLATIGFNWRFQPLFAQARAILQSGALGAVRSVTTSFTENGPLPAWKHHRRDGGGVLLDLASHHFDLIPWLIGGRVERAEALVRSEQSEGDSADVTLYFGAGAVSRSTFSLGAPPSHRAEIVGERGALRVDRIARTLMVSGVKARTLTRDILAWRTRALLRPRSEPSWNALLGAFVAAIRGKELSLPTLEDGLRSLELVEAVERAAGIA